MLLEQQGYKSYAFDMTSLKDATYWIEPIIQHYKDGKLVENEINFQMQFSSRDMVPQHDSEYVDKLRQSGRIYDEKRGILRLCERLRVGFFPSADQRMRMMKFYVTETGNYTLPLFFDAQIDLDTGEEEQLYNYGFREFQVKEIAIDKFIPLAMCGAHWYDTKIKQFRFCGDEILTEDMQEDILKLVKEYYIIGMKVHR